MDTEAKMDIGPGPGDLSYKFPFTVFYQGKYENIPSYGIIDMVQRNLDLIQEKVALKPMLYLLIETLQNIERYSTHKLSSEDCALIYMDKYNFYIYTQNLVDVKKVDALKERLDSLEGKTREELDKAFITVLASDKKTEKGAGLGLIDLARKTHNRMFYELHHFDEDNSLYSICYAMPINRKDLEHYPDFAQTRSIVRMLKNNFGSNRSTLFYSGDFSNKFIHALLNFLKKSKDESEGSEDSKLHYILIELTQNVRRHSSKVNGVSQGQLTIEWQNDGISISTFNPVQEPNGNKLQEKIRKINKCTAEELKEWNKAVLTDFTTESGVGLIDVAMLIKGEKILCDIVKKPNFNDELNIKFKFKNE
jgi:hypothetical protein